MSDNRNSSFIKYIFVMSALLFFVSVSSFAQSAERRVVRVGFFPFDGYHMVDSKGERSGYGYDYLQRLNTFAGWKYEYVGYEENKSWSDMLLMLSSGQIDMVTSATKTAERDMQFS